MATIPEALQAAVVLHQQGNLAAAEQIYQQILLAEPRQPDAWHLSGLVSLAHGDPRAAIDKILRAIDLDARQASFYCHLAEAQRLAGELSAAAANCQRAIELAPANMEPHNTLGLVRQAEGENAAAVESFREAVRLCEGLAALRVNLGSALIALGQRDEATAVLQRAIELNPTQVEAYDLLAQAFGQAARVADAEAVLRQGLTQCPQAARLELQLGALLQAQQRLDEARECYERALGIDPAYAEAHFNLGSIFKAQGHFLLAGTHYRRAIQHRSQFAEAHFNLGVVCQQMGEMAAAAECYREAIRQRPTYAHAHSNLGTILTAEGRLDEAIACYEQALAHQPNFAEALNNLGNAFKGQGRADAALVCYEQTIRIRPDYAQAHVNCGITLLANGDFAAGWPEYEWRLRLPDAPRRELALPMWDGSPLAARRLLVYSEQGLGDTLQCLRYVRKMHEAGELVHVELPAGLLPLARSSGMQNAHARGEAPAECDVQLPIMSLPHRLGTTLETIPRSVPYLAPDPTLVEQWRTELADIAGLKVGIAWQGSNLRLLDRLRSIPLATFAPLALPGVQLISLQKGPGSEQLAALAGQFPIRTLVEEFDSRHGMFMDTAAVMKHLDLIVTADTSIAHLAGGLGVPVWVALPFSADWRWLRDRDDSPWYPTMRLFRQASRGDWQGVLQRIGQELNKLTQVPES